MSSLEKRAYELAPYVADALREVAGQLEVRKGDERYWSEGQKQVREDAVDLAKTLLSDNEQLFGALLLDDVLSHARALADEDTSKCEAWDIGGGVGC